MRVVPKWLSPFRSQPCLAAIVALPLIAGPNPSHAFDCSKASTPTELAICGDGEALAANDAMEAAFFGLRDRSTETGRQILIDGQRAWLKARDAYCEAEPGCLAHESKSREEQLSATPSGMAPFFIWKDGGPAEYRIRISGYRFGDEQAAGASAYQWGLDDLIRETPLDQQRDPDLDFPRPFEHDLNVVVETLSARLISAVGYTYDYSGGAHPNSWSKAINIDRATGAPLNLALTLGRRAIAELADDCADQIARNRMEIYDVDDPVVMARQLEEEYPGEVLKHAANIERWHFSADTAVLRFDSYAIGPYAAGPFECEFELARIRAIADDGALFGPAN